MKKFKKYLKKFMFYFGAFAVTLTIVAGSKVALFLVTKKPNEESIHSEETIEDDNALTKVLSKVMETNNAKMALSFKIAPQDTTSAVDINADLYANIQDGKTQDGFNFNNIKLSLDGEVNFQNENIPFEISYINNYVYANIANVNFKLSTNNVVQDITKILNLTILDSLGVSANLPDLSNMTFSQDMLISLASKLTESDTESGKELTLDLFGYGDLVIQTNNEYLPQAIYAKNININGTQILANIDTNLKAEKQEIKEPDNKNDVMDITNVTKILEGVDKLAQKRKVGGTLSLNVYDYNFNVDYSLDFTDMSSIKLYAKTKLGSDYIELNYNQNKIFVSYKNLKYYYNIADFNLDKIVDALQFYLGKFNIELPEIDIEKLVKDIDLKYILGILANVNDVIVSENGLCYEKQDYMFALNLKDGEIDNIKATYKNDIKFVLTLNETIECNELFASEYKNIKDEKLVSKLIDGILYNKQLAFDISLNYNNEKIAGKLQIDLNSDIKVQLTLNVMETNIILAYVNETVYVEIGNIIRAKGTIADITTFVKQFDLPKLELDYSYSSLVKIYVGLLDILNKQNIEIDFVENNNSIEGIFVQKDGITLKLSVSDNFEITYKENGEYDNLSDILMIFNNLITNIKNKQQIYSISADYKQYHFDAKVKYINNKLSAIITTSIYEKPVTIFVQDNTIYANINELKLKCTFSDAKDLTLGILAMLNISLDDKLPKLDIQNVLDNLKVNVSGDNISIKFNGYQLNIDTKDITLNLTNTDLFVYLAPCDDFVISKLDGYINIYDLNDITKAIYSTINNNYFSGKITLNTKVYEQNINVTLDYELKINAGDIYAKLHTTLKDEHLFVTIENKNVYIDFAGYKLCTNIDDIPQIISWLNSTFGLDLSNQTIYGILGQIKIDKFDFIKNLIARDNKLKIELKDNISICIDYDELVDNIFVEYKNTNVNIAINSYEVFDIANINKEEYKNITQFKETVEKMYSLLQNFDFEIKINKDFVSSLAKTLIQNKTFALQIATKVKDLDITATVYVDILGDLKLKAQTTIYDLPITIVYENNIVYVKVGDILQAKDSLDDIIDFVKQQKEIKDFVDSIDQTTKTLDDLTTKFSFVENENTTLNIFGYNIELSQIDFAPIEFIASGEYQKLTDDASYIKNVIAKVTSFEPIYDINIVYKNYEITGKIKYVDKKLECKLSVTIFEKQLEIIVKNDTLYINFDGFKAKCSFENAKDLFEYVMTFAKDDIEKTFGKIELKEPDIAGILSELKIKISGNIAQVLYNDITLQLDSELATLSLAYNDVTLIANKTTNFNIDVTDSEYFDLYELKELSKAVYNTLRNMCISGNATANIKLFGELNTLNVNYKIGYVDDELIGYINTNFKGLDINIYMENNDFYFDIIGIKLHINTSELENIVSWINTTFDKNYSIDTKESLLDKLKNIHFDIVKSVKSTSGQTYVELKDNFDINLIFDDYIRQVEFYQNENGATLKCTDFEKFDLSGLNKSEYNKYTSYTTLIENVYNQIMQKQFNLSVSAKKYQNSKLIKSISGDVNLDVTNMLNAYVNILGLDEQITAYYSNKALYFCYGGDTGLKIKIREDAVQEILSIACSALNIDVSSIPLLDNFLTKEDIDTSNLSEIMPKIDTNPLKLLEYVETIHYTDTDLTIVIKGEKLGEYANGKDITIKICYDKNKLTNIEFSNLITNVETNEMINANIVFNDYTGVKQVENASKYIDLSDSKDLIRAFVNTSNLNDFHIVGGVKLNIDIGIKFDAATVGIDAKIKKIISKTKVFNEDTGELIETEKTSWDGYIEVSNYPIITGVNNATSNGVGLLSRKRVITIYFHEGNIYLSTVDNKSGACKEFSRMTKITPSYLVDNLKYYMNYLLGFTDSIQSKINDAIDKSQSYTGKTDYGNIVKQYTHSGSKHTIVVNLAEITHNSDIGTLTVIIETSNALTSDKKDYFKRLDIDMQLLDGMISLKTDSLSSQSDNQSLFLVDIGQSLDISKVTTFVENYDNVLGFGLNGEYEKEGTGSWKQVNKDERKIYFIDNGTVISTQTGIIASKITFPNMADKVSDDGITRVIYTFAGWYTDPNHKTLFTQDTFASSNLTLFAKWDIKEQKKYTKINFVTNDERVTVDTLVGFVEDNLALPVLANISEDVDEYTSKLKVFLGWQTQDGQDYAYTTFQDGEITLYAKWEEIITKTYDLTIYHNADVIYSGKVKADEQFDISTLEIYELYTKVYSTCDFDENNLVTSFVVSQSTTWYIRNAYYVTVVSSYTTQNGDPYYNKQTLYEGSTLSLPTYSNYEENKGTYTVEYKFKGYKLEGSDTLITTNSVTTVSGDINYTAVWDVKEYCIVTFDVSAWINPSWWKPTKILPVKFVSRSTVSNTNNTNQVKIERNTNLVFSSYVATCQYKYGATYSFKTVAWGDSVQNLYDGDYSGATSLKITGNITLKPIWVHA